MEVVAQIVRDVEANSKVNPFMFSISWQHTRQRCKHYSDKNLIYKLEMTLI